MSRKSLRVVAAGATATALLAALGSTGRTAPPAATGSAPQTSSGSARTCSAGCVVPGG